jgi:thiol-disulfide isomerase/thioredoxin
VARSRLPLSWILGATAVALAAYSLVVVFGSGGDDEADGQTSSPSDSTIELSDPGDLPPSVHDVVLQDIGGEGTRPLHSFMDGKPVVVNFFASWCNPCIEEMPAFERVHQELGDQVHVIGLAYDQDAEATRDLVERTGVTYPTFADPEGSALSFFESMAMPTTVFIAPDGEILDVNGGELSEDDLRSQISELFGIGADPGDGG